MKKLIVANWKMYLTLRQSIALAKRISKEASRLRSKNNVSIVLCPSFVAMEEAAKALHGTRIKLGAQDIYCCDARGAYTGEVGLDDLRELGVEYVLVGHSERRRYFKESDELINQKLRATIKAGLNPILCVGEPWTVRRKKKERQYVSRQVKSGLEGVTRGDLKRVVIAYEPVWAIGTKRPDSPKDASEMHAHIRKVVPARIPVLYGGSVNAKNAHAFLHALGVDGMLVGKASIAFGQFSKIIRQAAL